MRCCALGLLSRAVALGGPAAVAKVTLTKLEEFNATVEPTHSVLDPRPLRINGVQQFLLEAAKKVDSKTSPERALGGHTWPN